MKHPYSGSASYKLWNRSVAFRHRSAFDPVVNPRFALTAADAIATMGSCFAQHLTRWLVSNGMNFFSVGDEGGPPGKALLFSANYGNTYTVAQAVQLIEAAFGLRRFSGQGWADADGGIRDPLRPAIPNGVFASVQDMLDSRERLFQSVRAVIDGFDCFVFTLGLTETWIRLDDGAALPSAPGVIAGDFTAQEYRFVNFTYDEVLADLVRMIEFIHGRNRNGKIILTVSPVPLAATYEERHVAVSSMASKAILRAATDAAWRRYDFLDYFPSLELFLTAPIGSAYFEEDMRHIRSAGVNHAMRLFRQHYFPGVDDRDPACRLDAGAIAQSHEGVICNEDLIV